MKNPNDIENRSTQRTGPVAWALGLRAGSSSTCSRALIFAFGLVALLGCNGLVSDGGTDTSTNWYHTCKKDAECGGEFACLCGVCTLPCEPLDGCPTLPLATCRTDSSCEVGGNLCLLDGQRSVVPEEEEGESWDTKELPLIPSLAECEQSQRLERDDQLGAEFSCGNEVALAVSCLHWGSDEALCVCGSKTPLDELFYADTTTQLLPSMPSAEGDALILRPVLSFDDPSLESAVGAAAEACLGAMGDPNVGHCVENGSTSKGACSASRECSVLLEAPVGRGRMTVAKGLTCTLQDELVECHCGKTKSVLSLEAYTPEYCEEKLDVCFGSTDDW